MKKFLDCTLLILFFAALASNFTSSTTHQIIGFAFLALVVAHNVLEQVFIND